MTQFESGERVREYYRKQGAAAERIVLIKMLRGTLCFDFIEQTYCTHHGGKCQEVQDLIDKLERVSK